MPPSSPTLETARLRLRRLRPGDEDAVHALLSDERVVRHMLFPLFTRERAAAFVARMQPPADTSAADGAADPARQLVLALVDRADDALVGLCGIVPNPALEDGELWYLLRPDRWGRGLVAEGVARLVEHAFRDRGLHRIWASCLPENPASARVLEKLGFRREGLLRQNLRIRGAWHDSYLYAVLAEEWPRANPRANRSDR